MKSPLMIWVLAFSLGLNLVFLAGTGVILYGVPKEAVHAAVSGKPPFTRVLQFDEDRLKLTAEQRRKFKEIRERWERDEWQDRTASLDRINRLGGVLVQEEITTSTLRPLLREIRHHSDDFFVRLGRAIRECRAVLSPEQNKIFTQMLQERFEQFQGMLRRRMQRHQHWLGAQPGKVPPPPANATGH